MEIFLFWLVLSILVAIFANNRGKSGALYFLLSVLLSPLLGFLIALVSGDNSKMKCSNCGQKIDINAKVCPFCNEKMTFSVDNKRSSIQKINDSISKLVLNKELTSYTFEDLKNIAINNYEEKYRGEVSVNNDYLFSIKGKAGEFGVNYLQIESKEDKFVIEAYNNIDLLSKFEIKEENKIIKSESTNVDKLIELGKLYKDGLLTKEEFEEQKNLLKKENIK